MGVEDGLDREMESVAFIAESAAERLPEAASLRALARVFIDLKRQVDEMLLMMVHHHNAIVDLKARVDEMERPKPDVMSPPGIGPCPN